MPPSIDLQASLALSRLLSIGTTRVDVKLPVIGSKVYVAVAGNPLIDLESLTIILETLKMNTKSCPLGLSVHSASVPIPTHVKTSDPGQALSL